MSDKPNSSEAWLLRHFPDSPPGEIVQGTSPGQVNPEELQRANFLWKRRPTEITLLLHLLILGLGALGHAFFIFVPDPLYLMVYHLLYVCLAVGMVSRFVWAESQYRQWKQDYLRSVARLAQNSSGL